MDFQSNRTAFGIVALVLLLFAVSVFFYNRTLNELAAGTCSDDSGACPHEKIVDTQNIVILALVLVILGIVGWMAYQIHGNGKHEPEKNGRKRARSRLADVKIETAVARRKIYPSVLNEDERKVVAVLQENDGSAFQSDINRRTGYSKVKVSRILDRLEHAGLIERKRRGMANLVVLK